jgi:hypothetical protein
MAITQQISNKLGTLVFKHVGFLYFFWIEKKMKFSSFLAADYL